ncbi:unnamed protein product [Ectocarpus sp. CCAP 1310/34]|nr:unnamed protein product [Ectocarpus sp. CCAP 1310/34]
MTLEAQAALNLDLRHVMFMQNAAEPVRSSTGRDFTEAFAAVGLPAHFLNAAYGLAEHTVGCSSFSPNPEGRNLALIPDERLEASGNMEFSCKLGHVKIVDPETSREMPAGETGEMWVSSASVAAGYWGKPELTNETFHARIKCDKQDGTSPPLWADFEWLRTGDLCRVDADGILYVKGRIKDLIIVAGRNIYPQDIEFSAQEASPLVRPGCVAAFSEEELGGSLQIVLEIRKTAKGNSVAIREALEAVRANVIKEAGLCPSTVVAIRQRCIPKTTSGKIQRRKTRALLQSGGLDVVQELSKDSGPHLLQATRAVAPALAHDPDSPETIPPPAKAGTPVDRTLDLSKTARTSADSEDSLSEECNGGSVAHRANFPLQAEEVLGIIEAVTGMEGLRLSDDLLNLGVDSLSAVGISSKLSEASGLEIPPELVFTHPNAGLIAEYVRSQGGSLERIDQAKVVQGLPRELDQGTHASSAMSADGFDSWNCPGGSHSKKQAEAWTMGPMRGWAFRLSQAVKTWLSVEDDPEVLEEEIAMELQAVDEQLAGVTLDDDVPSEEEDDDGTVRTPGLLVALAPIIWFASFTVMVIVAKWLVLGRQAQGCIPLGTHVYLSWWYTNTMLSVWETTGGRWLLDTKLAILFYRMMGAKVAWSASVKGFLREFDSIHIREGAEVAGELYARRFEASYMLVMPIVIGEGATVASGAVVYGGTNVGEYCVVSPLTVIPPSSKLALAKQGSIVFTLAAVVSMTYAPTILHESMGISDAFRYSSLVSIILEIFGVGTQLALLTILLKWALAGRAEGIYQPTAFRTWRRWYLGRLHTFVQAYFLVFNRFRRYDWWGAALGMSVGTGSVILLAYNPEDAHLYKVGGHAHLANPTLSADRATGIGSEREKKAISIGSRAMIGEGSYLGAGSTVGSSSLLGGYALVRPGEKLADGKATMCDIHSAYQLGALAPSSPRTDSLAENFVDAACSLGAWLLNALALVTTLEATKFCAEFSPRHSTVSTVVLSMFAIMAWALSTAVLLALFRWTIGGNLHVVPSTGVYGGLIKLAAAVDGPGSNRDVETGLRMPGRKKASITLGGCQVMRWRWMRRVLCFSLFEPFVLEPLLKGTWLLNAWLRLMGADVSMGAIILGRVSDYGGVTVCDGAVVAGVVYGHVATFVDGKWTMTVGPSTVGV